MKIPALILLLFVVSSSCKKESSTKDEDTIVKTQDTYQPLSAGSYWKYTNTFGNSTETATNTITGKSKKINNKTYYEISQASKSTGTQLGYLYNDDHSYMIRASTYMNGVVIELQYLTDNLAVGKTWTVPITDNGQVNGIPARVIGKILEKNISHTVNGKAFINVIHSSLDLQYDLGGYSTVITYEFYVAKGVGIIHTKSSSGGVVVATSKLTEYSIK